MPMGQLTPSSTASTSTSPSTNDDDRLTLDFKPNLCACSRSKSTTCLQTKSVRSYSSVTSLFNISTNPCQDLCGFITKNPRNHSYYCNNTSTTGHSTTTNFLNIGHHNIHDNLAIRTNYTNYNSCSTNNNNSRSFCSIANLINLPDNLLGHIPYLSAAAAATAASSTTEATTSTTDTAAGTIETAADTYGDSTAATINTDAIITDTAAEAAAAVAVAAGITPITATATPVTVTTSLDTTNTTPSTSPPPSTISSSTASPACPTTYSFSPDFVSFQPNALTPRRSSTYLRSMLGRHKSTSSASSTTASSAAANAMPIARNPLLRPGWASAAPSCPGSPVSTTSSTYTVPGPPSSSASGLANASGSASAFSASVKETHHISINYDPISGRKVVNTYELLRQLGRGQHGKVKLARSLESGEFVAIKILDRTGKPRLGRMSNSTQEDKIRREIAILKKCVHPNIVRLIEVLDDSLSKKIYLVLEYVERGEILWHDDYNNPLMTRQQVRTTARDVLLGLEYLHFQGIIHRDIKPANLLVAADGTVKISDFGVSYISSYGGATDELELAKTAGTPAFFAPELCSSSATTTTTSTSTATGGAASKIASVMHPKSDYTFSAPTSPRASAGATPMPSTAGHKSSSMSPSPPPHSTTTLSRSRPPISHMIDIWAFGVTLFCLIYGRVPFIADSEYELFSVIVNQPLEFPSTESPDDPMVHDLLSKVLEKDPNRRYDIHQIKRHPWILQDLTPQQIDQFLTSSRNDESIEVTGEEVRHAVSGIRTRIKNSLSKISNTALELAGLRRKSSGSSIASSSQSSSHQSSLQSSRDITPTGSSSCFVVHHPQPHHVNKRYSISPSMPSSLSTEVIYDDDGNAIFRDPRSRVHGISGQSSAEHTTSPSPTSGSTVGAAAAAATAADIAGTGMVPSVSTATPSNFSLRALLEPLDSSSPSESFLDAPPSPLARDYHHHRNEIDIVDYDENDDSSDDDDDDDDSNDGELTLVLGPSNHRINNSIHRSPSVGGHSPRPPRPQQQEPPQPSSDGQPATRLRSHSITVGALARQGGT